MGRKIVKWNPHMVLAHLSISHFNLDTKMCHGQNSNHHFFVISQQLSEKSAWEISFLGLFLDFPKEKVQFYELEFRKNIAENLKQKAFSNCEIETQWFTLWQKNICKLYLFETWIIWNDFPPCNAVQWRRLLYKCNMKEVL